MASVLALLSHADVVPVEQESWRGDPFGAQVVERCSGGGGRST
jgi:acetylornithine deacetylase/succinyl-diaminopimelate desuccinylase-like protein